MHLPHPPSRPPRSLTPHTLPIVILNYYIYFILSGTRRPSSASSRATMTLLSRRRHPQRRCRRRRCRRSTRTPSSRARSTPRSPPSLPYKVDTSRPSLRTNWTRLGHARPRGSRGRRGGAGGRGPRGGAGACLPPPLAIIVVLALVHYSYCITFSMKRRLAPLDRCQ
jgi:hypothetical protein